ncbi:MAG: hypothetical protein KDD62_06490, partial [Bdellovibrionales bacterium]|nr:hypothetical protein [Bdellovibrionales bacterium]
EALSDYSNKEAARLSTIDKNRRLSSFTKLPPLQDVRYARPEKVDEEKWVRFCKHVSKWLSELKQVNGNYVEFDASRETKIFVSTENRVIVQHNKVFSLVASIRQLTPEGLHIEQEVIFNVATQKELPSMRQFKRALLEKYDKLRALITAKRIHSFSGPVLLMQRASGLLFHEAIGHRIEGSRLLSSGEGQTFKGQQGKRVVNVDLDIYDDPTLKKFDGVRCIGAYDYDDEGTPSARADLVEAGKLKGFLTTRSQVPMKNFEMNGHARNRQYQRPISRMGVTVVEGRETVSMNELKALLIEEIREQRKPFGMIVYDTAGGETDTTSYDFQAFSGEISFASLVYPDGSEVICKGVDFVGTPLQALNNIIAVGDELEMENHYCGAESGFIPVTTIAPAVLLKNLELQAKEEELVTQYLLPRPKL